MSDVLLSVYGFFIQTLEKGDYRGRDYVIKI